MNNTQIKIATDKPIMGYKEECEDGFSIEYEILPALDIKDYDERRKEIYSNINVINQMHSSIDEKVQELNSEIDKLTNHADSLDYLAAVLCGLICGIVDIVFVGKWDFANAKAISNQQCNEMVMEFAKKQGYKGERLEGAITYLENKFSLPGDNDFHQALDSLKKEVITTKTHHLDDFCHHPTLIGMICCVLVQFTGSSIYSDKTGTMHNIPIIVNEYGNFVGKNPVSKMFSGIINWFLTVAKTLANRKGHLMSDIAGSHSSAGGGTGLPGSFLSLMKELAALPCFKDKGFNEKLRKAFQNGIGTKKSQVDLGAFNKLFEGASSKLDMRTEKAITHELKRQAIPVVINEVLVRGYYFVRHLCNELKEKETFTQVDWRNVIPFNNRTIARMMTIASGTLTAIDLAQAAIMGAVDSVKEGGINPAVFFGNMLLRVNFVGVGRFVVAIGTDIAMGVKRQVLITDRLKYKAIDNTIQVAKLYYLSEDMWIQVTDTEKAINDMFSSAQKYLDCFTQSWSDISDAINNIEEIDFDAIENNNPGLIEEMKNILEWS